MKPLYYLPVISLFLLAVACNKETIGDTRSSLKTQVKDAKPDDPVPLGCIRGYFGNTYMTFTQQIEKVQPIDSFSNVFFYGSPGNTLNQINLIRSDSNFKVSIFILGYPLDSLPASQPVPEQFCKYAEIQFSPLSGFNWGLPGSYVRDDFYGKDVFITDKTDDVLTGTFEGMLGSSTGDTLRVTDGEFKIKIFRKHLQ